ncbi:MAG: autotransporter-associated beta strand repeat-containing protein, partial [Kiritimatiellia bacterium]
SKAVVCGTICAFTANAVDYTWDGGGGDSNWTTVANWDKSSGYPGTTAGLTDKAFVAAAEELHIDTNAIVKLNKIDFSPVPSRSLTVTGAAGAGLDTIYLTVGGTSVLEFIPDIALSGVCVKDGSGIFYVPGDLTAAGWFYINAGTLWIAGGNAVLSKQFRLGNSILNRPATLHLTDGATMQCNGAISTGGDYAVLRLSGGTLRVAAGGALNAPLLIEGTNTIDSYPLAVSFQKGLSMTGPSSHLIKSGAAGMNVNSVAGTTNFVAGGLTISNSYITFGANILYESYGGSTEPWHVKICNGGTFRVHGLTSIFTLPLDLEVDPGGAVDFPATFGNNYNVLLAHSVVTNGVSLQPGRYKTGSGSFITSGLGSVALATQWTGAGEDSSWFNPANWSGDIPNGLNAVADISNAEQPVDLGDQDVTLTCLVYNPQGTQRSVTVTGSGTMYLYAPADNDGCLVVGPGRTLTLDVAIDRANGSASALGIFGNGTVVVKKGFPANASGAAPSVSVMGNLVFDGTTDITDFFFCMAALSRPNVGTPSNLFDATVTFATNCRMTAVRFFSNPANYYPVKQIVHDGAEITLSSTGYVLLTRYADDWMPPFTYFMRAGKLTLPSNSPHGVALGFPYTAGWESKRRGGASFVMTGGEVTTPMFKLSTPEETLNLQGGGIYLGVGGIVSTTNLQGTVNLGGVAIHATGNWVSSLNFTLTSAGGATVLDTANKTVTLSGTLFGPGGLAKEGTGTLTLSGSNTFTGGVTVADGTLAANNGFANATNLLITASGAMLTLGSADSLSTNATLTVAEGGLLNLNFSGAATVNALVVNGVAKSPGIYDSGKPFITGTGVLSVRNGPPPIGTILLIQ